ncbi:MAG: hypothetical protein HFG68_09095 [Hungatella sp.]|nr:hypothetical protein [Hungatella sp.]
MPSQKKGMKGNLDNNSIEKLIRFGAIPFIIVILIIIILSIDHSGTGKEDSLSELPVVSLAGGVTQDPSMTREDNNENLNDNNETQSLESTDQVSEADETESKSSNPSETITDPSQYPLQQDALLELTGLIQSYCEAKEECDPDLLAWVFDMEDWSEEQKNEERNRMELVKASIKGYENISCYSIQGPEEDSYVIFPYYEIRYRETETLMPTFSWGYAKMNAEGRYYMVQETSDIVNDYIHKVGEKPELKAVMAQILTRQQEAIASDEVLQRIYNSFSESKVIIGGTAQ